MAKKPVFGVPVFDCLYLLSGALPKSKNQITGVFLSKFFAAGKGNPKNGKKTSFPRCSQKFDMN